MTENFWDNNPIFKDMSIEKLNFIKEFANKDKPTSLKDAMPFLIANMNLAKQNQIEFSKPEVQIICDLLCKDLPSAEQERVKKMLSLINR